MNSKLQDKLCPIERLALALEALPGGTPALHDRSVAICSEDSCGFWVSVSQQCAIAALGTSMRAALAPNPDCPGGMMIALDAVLREDAGSRSLSVAVGAKKKRK